MFFVQPNLNSKQIKSLESLWSTVFSRLLSYGAPWGARTPNLLIRSQALYPIELMAHVSNNAYLKYYIKNWGLCKAESLEAWETVVYLTTNQ